MWHRPVMDTWEVEAKGCQLHRECEVSLKYSEKLCLKRNLHPKLLSHPNKNKGSGYTPLEGAFLICVRLEVQFLVTATQKAGLLVKPVFA